MRYAAPPTGTYAATSPQPPPPHQQPPPYSQSPPMMPGQNVRPPTALVPPMSSPQSSNSQNLPQYQGQAPPSVGYQPVQAHWCFCKVVESRDVWSPFSLLDTIQLERAYSSGTGFSFVVKSDVVCVVFPKLIFFFMNTYTHVNIYIFANEFYISFLTV